MNDRWSLLFVPASLLLLTGIYVVYYHVQRHVLGRARELPSSLDDRIPFVPAWVWIYSGLYYVFFVFMIVTIVDAARFASIATGFVVLTAVHMAVFLAFPVKTPARWRDFDAAATPSTRFLAFIHRTDAPTNSMPSLHVGAATLMALNQAAHFSDAPGASRAAIFAFPMLVAASASFTKQHYVVDYPPAVALAYLSHWLAGRFMDGS
jgi:hypothetical protein